jgi:hypothetical protein
MSFESGKSFVLYLEPVLNTFVQEYMNVITVSAIPPGPLQPLVSTLNAPKLSPFREPSPFDSRPFGSCIYVLMRYPGKRALSSMRCSDSFMTADDIPAVLGFLMENGYQVDSDLSKMLMKSGVMGGVSNYSGKRRLIAMVRWLQ